MSISISKAFETAFSERYSKQNILIFMFAVAICYALYFYLRDAKYILLSNAVYFFTIILISGYAAVVNNNEINNVSEAFPSFSNLHKIILNGIKYIAGSFILGFILMVPAFIIGAVSAFICTTIVPTSQQSIWGRGVIPVIIPLVLFLYLQLRFFIPLLLLFFQNLQFKSFFEFKKTKLFLEERKRKYAEYIIKSFVLTLIGILIIFAVGIIFAILSVPLNIQIPKNILDVIISTISITVMCTFYALIIPSLNAQFVNLPKTDPIQTYNW